MSECVPLLPAARWWRGRLATLARVQGFLRIGGWLPVQTRGKVRRRHAPGCSQAELLTDGISPSPSLRPCLWDQRHGTFETFTIPISMSQTDRHLTLQLLLFIDLLARQNYWDPAIGLWPTHTVSKWSWWLHPAPSHYTCCVSSDPSNINILEEPATPPGQLCPDNWTHFRGSCYLLRNQVTYLLHYTS